MERNADGRPEVGAREGRRTAGDRGVIGWRGRGIVRRAEAGFVAIPGDSKARCGGDFDEVADWRNRVRDRVHFDLVDVQSAADAADGDFDPQTSRRDGAAALGHVEAVAQVTGEAAVLGAGQILHRADGGPTCGGIASFRRRAVRAGHGGDLERVSSHGAIRAGAGTGVPRTEPVVAAPGDAADIDGSGEAKSGEWIRSRARDPTVDVAVQAVVQVRGDMEWNSQFRPQIAAGKRHGAVAGQGDVVRWSGTEVRAVEAAVVAVPVDGETGGWCDDQTRMGSGVQGRDGR